MTIGQKLRTTTAKPLTICLTTLFFTSVTILAVSPICHAQSSTSTNVISSTPSTTTTPASTSNGMTSPSPTSTTTTTTSGSTPVKVTTTPVTTTISAKTIVASPTAPVDQANMNDNDIVNWASNAAQLAYTYDFKNYPKQLLIIQDNFTPEGWKAFNAALKQSNNLNVVQNRKLVASATPTGRPVLIKEGVKNGYYTWRVQIPMQATYESESRLIKQNLVVTMLVTRSLNNPKGVGISHFLAVIVPSNQPPITTNPTAPTSMTTSGSTTSIYNQAPGTTSTPDTIANPTPGVSGSTTTTTPSTTMTTPGSTTVTPGSNTMNTPASSAPTPAPAGPSTPGTAGTSVTTPAPSSTNVPPSPSGMGSMGTGNTIPTTPNPSK